MNDLVAALLNEVAAEVEAAVKATGVTFAVRRTRATARKLRAQVGSDDPASLVAEYGGQRWAGPAFDGARLTLEKRYGDQRNQ